MTVAPEASSASTSVCASVSASQEEKSSIASGRRPGGSSAAVWPRNFGPSAFSVHSTSTSACPRAALVFVDHGAQAAHLLLGAAGRPCVLHQPPRHDAGEQREGAGAERHRQRHRAHDHAGIVALREGGAGCEESGGARCTHRESPTDPDRLRPHPPPRCKEKPAARREPRRRGPAPVLTPSQALDRRPLRRTGGATLAVESPQLTGRGLRAKESTCL